MFKIPGMDQGPRLDRKLNLTLQGDWGQANFHRICSWLAQEIADRCASGTKIAIVNGVGGADAPLAIQSGDVDLAISTPCAFSTMATKGVGPFASNPVESLRALAVLPQDDRMTFALDSKYGIRTFEQLRESRLPLKLGIGKRDNVNLIGFAGEKLFAAHGITDAWLQERGGRFVERERPEQCLADASQGVVDGLIQEAIMTDWWIDVMRSRNMNLIPFETAALQSLEEAYGWRPATIKAGYFDGLDADVTALDFSDFQLLVSADLPDDVAYLITWCLCETKETMERQYHRFPKDRTPMGYPLNPEKMLRSSVTLHPGAEKCYRDLGHL
ncbi:TAXI family TRAP transporter solute-binding subunit [Burkholderia cepacia]|uniref:TAXI family TRAP transporter solute-binding subunit n=1 Tax=Burkholderia cepacia TaxID=292 RepID=UPI002AB6E19D|nr:TAXI family TRAP transporter solute-binding subunit [Burkholderia cepacia]